MKKGNILAAIFGVVALFGTVFALNPTVFSDLKATNFIVTTIYDSNSVARFAPGSTNAITGGLTVSGTLAPTSFTVATSTAPRDTSATIGITPTAAGQLVYNSTDKELCLSTSTNRFSWVEVSTLAVVACRH